MLNENKFEVYIDTHIVQYIELGPADRAGFPSIAENILRLDKIKYFSEIM